MKKSPDSCPNLMGLTSFPCQLQVPAEKTEKGFSFSLCCILIHIPKLYSSPD